MSNFEHMNHNDSTSGLRKRPHKTKMSPNHKTGIALENPIAWYIKNPLKTAYDHNDFSPSKYPMENKLVVDGVAKSLDGQDKALLEMTNPAKENQLSEELASQKFDYFHRADPKHNLIWVMIISFISCLSKEQRELAKSLRIHIIQIGFQATKENFGKVINRLYHTQLRHILKSKPKQKTLTNFVHNTVITQKPKQPFSSSLPLPLPSSVSSSSINLPSIDTLRHNLHLDTITPTIENTITNNNITEETEIDKLDHPLHEEWLDIQINRLKQYDKFQELPY